MFVYVINLADAIIPNRDLKKLNFIGKLSDCTNSNKRNGTMAHSRHMHHQIHGMKQKSPALAGLVTCPLHNITTTSKYCLKFDAVVPKRPTSLNIAGLYAGSLLHCECIC